MSIDRGVLVLIFAGLAVYYLILMVSLFDIIIVI